MSTDIIRAVVRIDIPCHCGAIHGIMSTDIIRAVVRIDIPCHCGAIHGIMGTKEGFSHEFI